MHAVANQFLAAIEREALGAVTYCLKDQFSIALTIDGKEVNRVGCLLADRPFARTSHDGRSVEVFPSPGMPDGFEIQCQTHEEAVLIAESIDECFESAYLTLLDPDRSL